ACGFTLRGASLLPASMARVNLQAEDSNSALFSKLEAELKRSGVELVSTSSDATTVLNIISDTADERVLSVSARGEPQEYELFHSVVFTLRNSSGTVMEPVSVTLTRDYFFDEDDILGKTEDASFLRDALAEDVARLIVRRAALALRAGT
ncbi:MAG: hypothetical protein HKM98_01050, partial [Gammaproteobacteria bacterium]|nr:hypothetical protein [Gammaproteobacteria bacterium]